MVGIYEEITNMRRMPGIYPSRLALPPCDRVCAFRSLPAIGSIRCLPAPGQKGRLKDSIHVIRMKETTIVELAKIKPYRPVLIAGLPGIGMIGNIVARHITSDLKARKIAEMYSPHFPHQVFIGRKGGMRLIKNRFYHVKGKKHDMIVLLGDVQAISSVGQYEVAHTILQYAKKLGVQLVITVGGYSTGKLAEERRIFGAATHKSLVQHFKKYHVVFGQARGSIVGAAGLLPALARLQGLSGICLMGETHGGYVDATAAKNIVGLLSTYLDIPMDTKKLEEKAKESEKILRKIEDEIQKNIVVPYEPAKKPVSYIR